ncbi:MAG: GGDEF domain-containing protein, partial [Lachnospiraceae bacterium]|nr:GGDEF domain-containing protein [Lachnospiraceae bacterium]
MIKKQFGLVYVIITCFLLIISLAIINGIATKNINYSYLEYDWRVTINGKTYENVKLSDFDFSGLKKGDLVVLSNHFPKHFKSDQFMFLGIQNSTIDVLYNEQNQMVSVHSFGHEAYKANRMIGNTMEFVHLPIESSGKYFEIVLRPNINLPFYRIITPRLCEDHLGLNYFYRERFLNSAIGGFLIFFGFLLIFLSALLVYYVPEMLHMFLISVFIILVSLWSLNCNDTLVAFFKNSYLRTMVEFLSLYNCMIPIMLYVYFRQAKEPRSKLLLRSAIIANVLFVVGCCILHATGVCFIVSTLPAGHLMMVVNAVVLLYNVVVNYSSFKSKYLTVSSGTTIVVFGILDMINFIVSQQNGYIYNSIIPVGVLLFVIQWLISFLYEVHLNYINYTRQEVLVKMAYEDYLTGLDNRAVVEECFDDSENSKNNYAVISYDLNCLKQINDSKGHEAGDEYIVTFSNVLKDFWKSYGTVARIGGDEFLVIISERSKELITALSTEFEVYVRNISQNDNKVDLRFSYGVAFRDEKG